MNLKSILPTLADYNRQANFDLIKVLKALPEARFDEAAGSYFHSIAGILNHVFAVDLNWMRRFSDNGILTDFLTKELTGFTFRPPTERNFASLAEYEILRRNLDNLIEAVTKKIPADRLEPTITFAGLDGQPKTLPAGAGFVHLFNHATHHRGNVSQILDGWGVANDYSNLMRFFLE